MNHEELLAALRTQAARLQETNFYADKFQAVGFHPEDLKSLDEFRQLPLVDFKEIERATFEQDPPYGPFWDQRVVRINFTQSGKGLLPVLNTKKDIELMNKATAEAFAGAGLRPDDILLTTYSSHVFPAGQHIQGAVETLGAKMISMGPGETERTLEVIKRFGVKAIYTNPSFALKLAEKGMQGIRILFGGGEPFSSVRGLKERMRQTLGEGVSMIDGYALSHCMPLARECRFETGLHPIEELVYLEIIDPVTGEVVPDGTPGEVVVTQLHKEAMPLFRYRTGDLSLLRHRDCACGRTAALTQGVLGRVDNMVKVKGVKVYPDQIRNTLRAYPALANEPFRLTVTKKQGGDDHFRMEIKAPAPADVDALVKDLKADLLIKVDELVFNHDLEDGLVIVDQRY